jgi:hypothetical protein
VYANVGKKVLCWRRGAAHIVFFSAVQGTVDTGNQPYLNINTPLGAVGTDNAALGLQCDDTPWVWASNGGIDPDNYSVSLDDPIEISCTQAGENGDAADLTVSILFVLE